MADLPIACSLDAAALGRRASELRATVLSEAAAVERLSNGYQWRFTHTKDLFTRLAPLIDAERQCCRFLHFVVSANADDGEVTLEITGPSGTADFMESWIVPKPDV